MTRSTHSYPSTSELKAVLDGGTMPQNHWALRELSWSEDRTGYTIAEAGRGNALNRYAVFTVGLIASDHPDLVVIGMNPEAARMVLVSVARFLIDNEGEPDVDVRDVYAIDEAGLHLRLESDGTTHPRHEVWGARLEQLPIATERALFPPLGLPRPPGKWEQEPMLLVIPQDSERRDLVRTDADTSASPLGRRFNEVIRAEQEVQGRIWYEDLPRAAGADRPDVAALDARRQARARIVEAAYSQPGELDTCTPFKEGMLYGKLSALRWVLGEEWDFLDWN